jgi:uncharacterized protein YcbK (DUF882 family)
VKHSTYTRRNFLGCISRLAVTGAALSIATPVLAAFPKERRLAFENLHTGKRLDIVYSLDGRYLPDSLSTLNVFLLDHYNGSIGHMDPKLFDLLYRLKMTMGFEQPIQVISAYRSPATNRMLRKKGHGGVAKKSMHMQGKAIDLRIPDVSLKAVRDAALRVRSGGVGYYPRDRFVHIDTGPVRSW